MNRGIVFILFATLLGCGGDASTDSDASGEETGETGTTETGVDAVEDVEIGEESGEPDVVADVVTPDDAGTRIIGAPDGEEQVTVDPMVCTASISEPLQAFGGACCYTASWYTDNNNCQYGEPQYPLCADSQCQTGDCSAPAQYCTKECVLGKDKLDNDTMQNGFDGVTDPDEFNPCGGAVDGPVGDQFRCTNYTDNASETMGVCRPGTTFRECVSTTDCPDDETCMITYIGGKWDSRCMVADKNGVGVGEACNQDPEVGPLVACAGAYCSSSYGCVTACADASDCATDTCVEGACTKDATRACTEDSECSALECAPVIYDNDPFYERDLCSPRKCSKAGDCGDADWFCRPFWNGADDIADVGMASACRPLPEGAVGYGEACGVSGDGTGLPPCAYGTACIDNHCAGPCSSDADCGEGTECLLGWDWDIDVDDDGVVDGGVNVDVCRPWEHEGELTSCESSSDCSEGHHCAHRIKGSGEGTERTWVVEHVCRKTSATDQPMGAVCSNGSGNTCETDLCLFAGGTGEGMCVAFCETAADCPAQVEWEGVFWKTYCASFATNVHQTLDPVDDLYVAHCWRTSSFASVDSCDEHLQCAGANEFCKANAIAGNPDELVTVDHRCHDATQGLEDAPPTLAVGQACTSWQECLGRSCKPDGNGGGYCSALCTEDSDCASEGGIPGLKCTTEVLVPRPDPALSGVTSRCLLESTCLACETDNDCGGAHLCVNVGTGGTNADFRCAAPCDVAVEDGCDEGQACSEWLEPSGKATGVTVCKPDAGCP